MGNKFAIEIKDEVDLALVRAIEPAFADFELKDVQGHFLIFNSDDEKPGVNALMSPSVVGMNFDHIQNFRQITVKMMVK